MNKNSKWVLIALSIIVLIAVFGFLSFRGKFNKNTQVESPEIRIGWQIPWAIQGQLVQVLKHTPILENHGVKATFKGFTYGGPLNEAALAGEVDMILTADQPAATLLSKNGNWTIVGRLMYNRVSLYVPPMSPVQQVSDLKGKTVAMPFGAAAQRIALKAEEDAGLNPSTDVNNINLGIYEQSDLIRDPKVKKWGAIDAMAGFDPLPAIFEEKGLTRNLGVGKIVSVILVNNSILENNPEVVTNFLSAFTNAYDYYRNNVQEVDSWFVEESGLDITPRALEISASLEPNLKVISKDEIRIDFNDDDFAIMQEAADFIFDQGLVDKKVEMKNFVNTTYIKK
ncbi:ABC transporter substrate-binding protein [Candidatus Gracilibacteria bacterium]|jgi:ABC-type nitrate/sulfonate/bicarbonate transport system substrate-binding protein|nr:ABC transporter substrate-binding protein [Candidatus Gracilibacteria bacterium]